MSARGDDTQSRKAHSVGESATRDCLKPHNLHERSWKMSRTAEILHEWGTLESILQAAGGEQAMAAEAGVAGSKP